jgi:hypothetical protein
MADVHLPEFQKFWTQKLASLKFVRLAIKNEAASTVQQVYTVLIGTENLAGCTQAKVSESSEFSIVNFAGENRANFLERTRWGGAS